MRFYRNVDIERIAEQRLVEYEARFGEICGPPVPIEKLVGQVFGLTVLWDRIDQLLGETVLGGLNPRSRVIVLNESCRSLFEDKPGLERSTVGHEAGHWEFDVDKGALDYPRLFDNDGVISHRRSSTIGEIEIFSGSGCVPSFLTGTAKGDTPDQERVANRFAACISLPKKLIRKAAEQYDFMRWRDLYELAGRFEVNISALTVRLQQLGFIYIDENRQFHRSIAEAKGQRALF